MLILFPIELWILVALRPNASIVGCDKLFIFWVNSEKPIFPENRIPLTPAERSGARGRTGRPFPTKRIGPKLMFCDTGVIFAEIGMMSVFVDVFK